VHFYVRLLHGIFYRTQNTKITVSGSSFVCVCVRACSVGRELFVLTSVGVVPLSNDQQTLKEVVDFISAFQILLRHVSTNGFHLQGVVGAL
jgi:hypothetical protein